MIIPKPLFTGARVALIAPSGPVPEGRLEPAVASVQALGLEPVVFPSCTMRHGYLAGYDRERAADFNNAFSDASIHGVICIRGGYGAQRLMDRIDWTAIAKTPKVFCGYSDVTILHLMLNPDGMPLYTIAKGVSHGVLTGGNLSLLAASLGTPYEIETKDKILFIEDIGETPYRIDRMLLMLKQAGKLRACAGILLGAFTDCAAPDPAESLTLREVITELLLDEGKPILGALQCGHIMPTMSLPLGVNVNLDATNRTLRVLEY